MPDRRGGKFLRRRSQAPPAARNTEGDEPTEPYADPWRSRPIPPPQPPGPPRLITWPGVLAGFGTSLALNFVVGFAAAIRPQPAAGAAFVAINLAVIVIAIAMRKRGFGVGFALSYIITFVLLLGPCFELATKGLQVG